METYICFPIKCIFVSQIARGQVIVRYFTGLETVRLSIRVYVLTVPGLCEVLGPTGLLRYRQISYGYDFGIKSALTQKSSPQG